ncbi:MAG: phosphatidate cytidylyltransferase, partial [Clostridia bacterium]|nr:phosphatidate cytidylyltransferase [Clostridia bacterium]
YYIYFGLGKVLDTPLVYDSVVPAVVAFLIIGFILSIIAQIGDLFESAIKRDCGIKDSGKLLPGHGGVLDRFDSMLFCSVIVLVAFGLII